MTLLMLEIPDSHDELPVWLERQILGSRLGELIEQLLVIHAEAGGAGGSIEETLGSRLPEVLSRGLAVLPPAALSQLLTRPLLLLELQELVMSRGGSYWDDWEPKLVSDESITERGRERLKNFLGTERWLDQDRREPAERRRWKIRSLAINLASVAAAAGVVIGFWINRSPQAAPTASVDQPIGQLASPAGQSLGLDQAGRAAAEPTAQCLPGTPGRHGRRMVPGAARGRRGLGHAAP